MINRITPDAVKANVSREFILNLGHVLERMGFLDDIINGMANELAIEECKRVTLCVWVLENGHVIIGQSACVAVENFDLYKGITAARADVERKTFDIMAYELKSKLAAKPVGIKSALEQMTINVNLDADPEQIAAALKDGKSVLITPEDVNEETPDERWSRVMENSK
jgi:hypothetical protein